MISNSSSTNNQANTELDSQSLLSLFRIKETKALRAQVEVGTALVITTVCLGKNCFKHLYII